jgi:hypothetical protein
MRMQTLACAADGQHVDVAATPALLCLHASPGVDTADQPRQMGWTAEPKTQSA